MTALQVPFAVIGGVAFVVRVRVRATADVDAFLHCTSENLDRVVHIAREKGYDFTDRDVADFKDVFGSTLDRTYLRARADELGSSVRRRLDLLLPP